jgi:hypothetical protein
MMVHTCNPSYLRDRSKEDQGFKASLGEVIKLDPISKTN